MEVKEYLISVTAAAIISSCTISFFEKKGAIAKLIKVLCGIFVSLAVIQPLINLEISMLQPNISVFSENAQQIVSTAEEEVSAQQRSVIKQRAEAYVCDKATALGCTLSVTVSLCESPPYAPEKIEISGKTSPYAKKQLSAIITTDLGIEAEAQKWSS